MNILVITQHWYPDSFGGSEYVASEQARRLAARGHQITVVTEKGERGEDREKGITIYRYGSPQLFNRLAGASRAAVREVPRILTETESPFRRRLSLPIFDVAILHHPFPAYGFFRVKLNIPALYVFHASTAREVMVDNTRRNPVVTWFFAKWARYVESAALRKANRVGVFSDFSQSVLRETYPFASSKITRLKVGIDSERFTKGKNGRKGRKEILTVRRLWPRMGLMELLQAMEIVIKQISDASLIIVGEGPLKEQLQKQIKQLGLQKHITLAGRVSVEDLPRYYQQADLFVLPTQKYEGLGIATLEALASGLPVVGTPVGATPEILNTLDQSLITRSASVKDITDGVLKFFSRPEAERAEIGERACDLVERDYNWDKAIDQLEELLVIVHNTK